jgi:hypothetical protein
VSAKSGAASAAAGKPSLQKSILDRSTLSTLAAFAPASVIPHVMPHGCPASTTTSAFSVASATAPVASDHGPCTRRRQPRTGGCTGRTAPRRRRSHAFAASAMAAKTASCRRTAGAQPSVSPRLTAPTDGSVRQNAACAVATSEPAAKPTSATSIDVAPPPRLKRHPEPQPPASCMPIANTAAPSSTERPAGATAPTTSVPKTVSALSIGAKSTVATASMSIWARRPRVSPTLTSARKAAVNPKAAW